MPTKNLENLEKKGSDTNQKLKDLKFDIFGNSKDRKRFETLSKDSTLKKWIEKIYEKSCNDVFSKERKHFEKLHIGWTLKKMLQKYPNLRLEITWKLWLSLKERKFSNLTLWQKLKFTALYQSVNWNSFFDKKNPTSDDIAKRINRNIFDNIKKINRNFTLKNVGNFLKLEKTLKEDFKLTQSEALKVKEYLEIIKKHPEFIWINKPIEAASWWWYGIALVIGLILWAVWMHYIDNIWKIDPESTVEIKKPEIITVEDPESILKFMVTRGKFGNNPDNPIRWRDEIKMFTVNEDDSFLKKWAKEKINFIQSREIVMDLSWDVLGGFDLDKWCRIDIKTNYPSEWKWVAYVQLPEPDIMILNDEAKVVSENLERIHLSEFKDAQEKLRQRLRSEAEAWIKKDEKFYDMTKKEAKENLLKIFKNLKPQWMEIEDVEIRFFNPEKWETIIPTVSDFKPEQKPISFR